LSTSSYTKYSSRSDRSVSKIPSTSEIAWFRKILTRWFGQYSRDFPWRESSDPYFVCVSEILLQQTRASSVAGLIKSFVTQFPNWESLAKSTTEQVEQVILPLGLYQRRSKTLVELANVMVNLSEFPSSRDNLENLPGIGQYIANVLLVVFYKKRLPFLDVNMSRVLERFFGKREKADIRFDPYLQLLSRKVVNVKDPLAANWMILDFAALVCKKINPDCKSCVIRNRCKFQNY